MEKRQMTYQVIADRVIHDHFFTIRETQLLHDYFDGSESGELTRFVIDKGPAVACIIHVTDIDKYVLVKQFRYPVALVDPDDPWIYEIVAGTIEHGETPDVTAIKEIQEEAGFGVDTLEMVQELFLTPGISSELVYLYEAKTTSKNTLPSGDPFDDEEDVEVHLFTLEELNQMLRAGTFKDVKTWAAVNYLLNTNR